MMDILHLPMINLTPTMRCNLKCRLCGVLVPQYKYRPHMTLTEFFHTLAEVFNIVDRVGKLQITGGEPLLHAELPEMIEECFRYHERFEKLWLITNSAVPVSQRLGDVLVTHKDKLVVHISDYGVRRDVTDEMIRFFDNNGIAYKYLKYYGKEQYSDGWVDQGDFEKHDRPEAALAEVFSKCSHVVRGGSWYVRGGQMHWCGRSIRGTELEKVQLRDEDYLDIFAGTLAERRGKLRKLIQSQYILACDYCNGYYGTDDIGKRHLAGEQM